MTSLHLFNAVTYYFSVLYMLHFMSPCFVLCVSCSAFLKSETVRLLACPKSLSRFTCTVEAPATVVAIVGYLEGLHWF